MENYEDVLKEIEKEQNAAAQKYFADLLEKMESDVSADMNGKKKVQIDIYEDENGKQRLAVKDFDGKENTETHEHINKLLRFFEGKSRNEAAFIISTIRTTS